MARGQTIKVYNISCEYGSDYSVNVADIYVDHGRKAKFCQISNDGMANVRCRVDGDDEAVFNVGAGASQVFNYGDATISRLEFENSVSGGVSTDLEIIVGL